MEKKDIESIKDVEKLVDIFYDYVLNDKLLKPVFNQFMTHELTEHKQNIYDFWAFVLLKTRTYNRNLMAAHLKLPLNELHFLRWFYYFRRTIYEHFDGPIALSAIKRAEVILFTMKDKITTKSNLGIVG